MDETVEVWKVGVYARAKMARMVKRKCCFIDKVGRTKYTSSNWRQSINIIIIINTPSIQIPFAETSLHKIDIYGSYGVLRRVFHDFCRPLRR